MNNENIESNNQHLVTFNVIKNRSTQSFKHHPLSSKGEHKKHFELSSNMVSTTHGDLLNDSDSHIPSATDAHAK